VNMAALCPRSADLPIYAMRFYFCVRCLLADGRTGAALAEPSGVAGIAGGDIDYNPQRRADRITQLRRSWPPVPHLHGGGAPLQPIAVALGLHGSY
jgi:hypothetical protein